MKFIEEKTKYKFLYSNNFKIYKVIMAKCNNFATIIKISLASVPTYNDITVRPTFYLNSSIKYSSGSGTKDDPIYIDM